MGAGLLCCTVAAIALIPSSDLFAAQLELNTEHTNNKKATLGTLYYR